MESNAATVNKLDELLSSPTAGVGRLDDLLTGAKPSEPLKGKAKLNAENQSLAQQNEVLLAQNARMSFGVKVMAGIVGALLLVIGLLLIRQNGLETKMFRKAFEVLHYRESRALQANAIVVAEYLQGLAKIRDEVTNLPGISEDERQVRLKAMTTTIAQADNLKDGFLKLVKQNEKERGQGISFEYRDPFLKRPIKFDEELGGEINLDKLRDEVRANAKMDEAMKDLSEAMLNPIPIADQIRAEAKRQNAPVVDMDPDRGKSPATQPLQLPGLNPSLAQPSIPGVTPNPQHP